MSLRLVLAALLLALPWAAPAEAACAREAGASPPCGPIPVIIEIKLEKFRNLTFGDATQLVLQGTVSYYVNVDQDGFYYDPENKPQISFRINRQPPWVHAVVQPAQYEVPVDDPNHLEGEEGGAGEIRYYWEAPITVTVDKLRDPTAEELSGKWIRVDGTYRVSISGSSTASITAGDLLGAPIGLQEGYGVRELRFNKEGVASPGDLPDGPEAPGPAIPLLAAALLLAALGLRRRRGRRPTKP